MLPGKRNIQLFLKPSLPWYSELSISREQLMIKGKRRISMKLCCLNNYLVDVTP
ncbi:hypothetical protein KSP40_PGU013845 [Platanthera guangdongensis]|uniref:Translation initiation factor 1 n=1 Tax=Platanthera guangdongensis TaxID=2320717 RepID=A0ABR2LJR4_9ASPA